MHASAAAPRRHLQAIQVLLDEHSALPELISLDLRDNAFSLSALTKLVRGLRGWCRCRIMALGDGGLMAPLPRRAP